ncbi:hypothetical protein JR316_0012327 [Psilocybe cubensis]|uniref:Uncharacterized protein n=2 Tax=Psilocybe cubensis TaxID=181762 RepID=A0A8H8CG69_PSICU|nr:hypothetical protein JR316_0012327 [Psilocybe cubensis]KAH9475216.1 hypothetical protein JR316_0012327 [Psilocybe cubensis]
MTMAPSEFKRLSDGGSPSEDMMHAGSSSDERFSGTTLGSERFRESTNLIPSPGVMGPKPKRFEPIMLQLWFIILTPFLMLSLGIALEIAIYISNLNHGFKVPQSNVFLVFGNVTGQFLASFFPTLLIMPFAFAWRELDFLIRSYQPYVMLQKGNAKAEESLLLDYKRTCSPILAIPRALAYKHRIVLWSSITAVLTYIYQPLTGSIFQIQYAQQSDSTSVIGTQSVGLSPDIADLNPFMAAAGYVDASVLFGLPDPPFVQGGWATAEVLFPSKPSLNGTLSVDTAGIQTTANCSNSVGAPTISGSDNALTVTSTSVDGCQLNVTFDSTAATQQYGVQSVSCPGNASTLPVQFQPVMFWFFQNSNSQKQVKSVFCTPRIKAVQVTATASLNDGNLVNVTQIGDLTVDNNVTGTGLNQPPAPVFNGVIFQNSTNPFIQARVVATSSIVSGAIFKAAQQQPGGLASTFAAANNFLDLTSTYYTRHLSIVARSVYYVQQNTTLPANEVSLVPRLVVDPLPAHFLAIILILTGVIGMYLHVHNRRQRKTLLLATPPGSIASIVALTSRSGFGELLYPYDDELTLEKKLDGIRFRLDRRTGAILADDFETERAGMGRDDALLSLLGKAPNEPISAASHSSSALAYQAANGILPWERSWAPDAAAPPGAAAPRIPGSPLRTDYVP